MSASARLRTSSSFDSRALRRAGNAAGPRSRSCFMARSRAGNDGLPSCSISFSAAGGSSAATAEPATTARTNRVRMGLPRNRLSVRTRIPDAQWDSPLTTHHSPLTTLIPFLHEHEHTLLVRHDHVEELV